MDRPEALRLAEQLEAIGLHGPVAAELRRLHAQRDALLEALRWIDQRCPRSIMKHPPHPIHQEMAHDAGARARAAIKAVEEKT